MGDVEGRRAWRLKLGFGGVWRTRDGVPRRTGSLGGRGPSPPSPSANAFQGLTFCTRRSSRRRYCDPHPVPVYWNSYYKTPLPHTCLVFERLAPHFAFPMPPPSTVGLESEAETQVRLPPLIFQIDMYSGLLMIFTMYSSGSDAPRHPSGYSLTASKRTSTAALRLSPLKF